MELPFGNVAGVTAQQGMEESDRARGQVGRADVTFPPQIGFLLWCSAELQAITL